MTTDDCDYVIGVCLDVQCTYVEYLLLLLLHYVQCYLYRWESESFGSVSSGKTMSGNDGDTFLFEYQ